MPAASVIGTTPPKVMWDKRRVHMQVDRNVKIGLVEVGNNLVSYIRESMKPGSGRVSHTRVTDSFGRGRRISHRRSAPGEPPAPFTMRLHDSISWSTSMGDNSTVGPNAREGDAVWRPKTSTNQHTVSIGTNVPYSLRLERGGGKMKARPYLAVALKKNFGIIREAFSKI